MWAGIIGYLRRYFHDDEVVSHTIEKAMNKLHQFDPTAMRMETWLSVVARNAHRNILKAQREDPIGGTEELDKAQEEASPAGSGSGIFRYAPSQEQWAKITNSVDRCIVSSLLARKTLHEACVECGVTELAALKRLQRVKYDIKKAA
jgi:DNA-directed RNA polymerase specialized sigma24 family protein